MPLIKLPAFNPDKLKSGLKDVFSELAKGGFQKIYSQIDQLSIKKGVDQMGLDKFINQCALLAAGSGAVTGVGGVTTMLIGTPLDFVNLIAQQFRVTLAVAYYKTGAYQLNFNDFFRIVASSFKVDAGVTVSKKVMEEVAEKLMLLLGGKAARRLLPVVGAVIGGTANYMFIKRMAETVKKSQLKMR